MNNELTYEDSSRIIAREANEALFKEIQADWKESRKLIKESCELSVTGMNLLRAIGLRLQQASNHEQVSFDFYRLAHEQGKLPKDMTHEGCKLCVKLAQKYPDPINAIDQARAEYQPMLIVMGEQAPPKRGDQTAHADNPWDSFFSWSAKFNSLETFARSNLKEWDKDGLRQFIKAVEPIAKRYEEAKGLLE